MTWLFSQALAAAYLPASCSATEPSAPSKSTRGPQAYSPDGRTTDTFRRSRFGLMCAPLTADRGEALLIAFLADFHAKTSALRGLAAGWMGSARACGVSTSGWFARWSPGSSGWRTAQCSFLGDSEQFSATWPRSGSMLGGMCFQRPTLAPGICANGSGSLPFTGNAPRRLPTLAARDYRHPNAKSYAERGGGSKGEQLPNVLGGPLNPDWCEWFMGWPIGWTASDALATDRFREWRQQHGLHWAAWGNGEAA